MFWWMTKHILFPLAPFLIGTMIRLLTLHHTNINVINPSELGFSMALLSLIIILSTSRLDNRQLRDSISFIFFISISAFITLFAITLYLQIKIDSCLFYICEKYSHSQSGNIGSSELIDMLNDYQNDLKAFRNFIIYLAIIIIPSAIVCKWRYNLEDL